MGMPCPKSLLILESMLYPEDGTSHGKHVWRQVSEGSLKTLACHMDYKVIEL